MRQPQLMNASSSSHHVTAANMPLASSSPMGAAICTRLP
jgi:hypothetical protein